MALFQKNPFASDSTKPIYTLGLNKTVIIIGLGNRGKRFDRTRHNIGFVCVEHFAQTHEFDPWVEKKDLKCLLTSKTLGDVRVILVKPTTMMNLSGEAAQAVARFYKVEFNRIVAVYDEVTVPFGQIRMRVGGSSAGHNGVKSLIQHIGDEFGRVRVGIQYDGETHIDMADYVLSRFADDELAQLPQLTREATSILTEYVYRGELLPETRSFII